MIFWRSDPVSEVARLNYLLRLPWTFVRETTPEGDTLLRVAEIPSAVGTGETDPDLEADVWASLRASLEAYLHFGDPIPLPRGAHLPWESPGRKSDSPSTVILRQKLRLTYPTETAGTQGSPTTSQ